MANVIVVLLLLHIQEDQDKATKLIEQCETKYPEILSKYI